MEVLLTAPTVGEALDTHFAKDGGQGPVVSLLDADPWSPCGVDDSFNPLFALCAQIEVVLEQPTKQLPARYFEVRFECAVVESECFFSLQEVDDGIEVFA